MADSWEGELAALSRRLEPEASEYWRRHQPRFRRVAGVILELAHGRSGETDSFPRILDVGMSYETPLLAWLLPRAELTCLGIERDDRFAPHRGYQFVRADLDRIDTGPDPLDAMPNFDLIVCMEVIEHLVLPPEKVFAWFARHLSPGGLLLITTPNAAWLKNRLKLLQGRNPFEPLSADSRHRGHIREYTLPELKAAGLAAGLHLERAERSGLYRFSGAKDRFYSALADALHPSLRRTLLAVYRKP